MKHTVIIKDAAILFATSTLLVYLVNQAFAPLKNSLPDRPPLVTLILEGKTNSLNALLSAPYTAIDMPDHVGRTPLQWAAYANYASAEKTQATDQLRAPMVRLLIQHGAKVNAADHDGWTALMWASWSGLTDVVNELLAQGAQTTPSDRQGNTALTLAQKKGHADIVRRLTACQLR